MPNRFRSTLLILALIMVVNALSYGTIIPLLYPYAAKFGFTPLGLSLLFTSFSLAQFLATPVLGRLSDRFGRKPILVLCLVGTAASLGLFALAGSAVVIFIARIIDGITGGNISVAQAIISDSTEGQQRTKGFGMLGAAFGFGFLFGPAVGGFLSTWGLTAPFWFSAALALVAAVLAAVVLPETLKPSLRQDHVQRRQPLFKFQALYHALLTPFTGVVLLLSFLSAVAMNAFILGFQAYTNDVLRLSTFQIGIFFSTFGLIGILMQLFAIGAVLQWFRSKKTILLVSFIGSAVAMAAAFLVGSFWPFLVVMMAYAMIGAFREPMIAGLLSERTKAEDQGGILGINQAYVSLGQIVGPLLAGAVTTMSIHAVFLLAGGFFVLASLAGRWLYVQDRQLDL